MVDKFDKETRSRIMSKIKGWKVIRVWEHDINDNLKKIKYKILKKINQN